MRSIPVATTLAVLLLLLVAGLFTSGATAASLTFASTTNSDWLTAANWNPAQLPTTNDDVTIPNGFAVTYTTAATNFVKSITIASGGSLTINGASTSCQLTVSGTSTTPSNIAGTLTVSSPAKLALSSGTGRLNIQATGLLVSNGGSFTGSGSVYNDAGGQVSITSSTTMSLPFYLQGTSTLAMSAGAPLTLTSTASILGGSVTSGDSLAVLVLQSSATVATSVSRIRVASSATFSGAASMQVQSLEVAGGTATFAQAVNVTEQLLLRGGSINGASVLRATESSSVFIQPTNYMYVSGSVTVELRGTTNYSSPTSPYYMTTDNTARLINYGWMEMRSTVADQIFVTGNAVAGSGFFNYGTLSVAGMGVRLNGFFTHQGQLFVADSQLKLGGSGVYNGSVTLNSTLASMAFTGGSWTLWTVPNNLLIDGATVGFWQDATLASFTLNSGTVYVEKAIVVTTSMTLRTGNFYYSSTPGSITAAATSQVLIQPTSVLGLSYLPLILNGTTTFVCGSASLYLYNDGRVKNYGWLNVVASPGFPSMLSWYPAGTVTGFYNYGVMNISAPTPVTLGAPFFNLGQIYVANGIVNLANGGLQNGTVTLNNTQASFVFTGGAHAVWRGVDPIFLDGGTVSVAQDQTTGGLIMNSGSLYVNKQLTILSSMTLRGGSFNYDSSPGSVIAAASAQVLIQPSIGYIYLYYIPLILNGTTTFICSTYSLYLSYDGRLINNGWMNVVAAPGLPSMLSWYPSGSLTGFYNDGVMNVSAPTPVTLGAAFFNRGQIYVASGTVNLANGGLQNGTVTLNNTQASLVFTGGIHVLWRGVDPVFIDGGTVSVAQDQTIGSLIFNSGSLYVNKQLTVQTSMTLRGGTFSYDSAAGSIIAASSSQVLIQPSIGYIYFYYIPLILNGITTFISSSYAVYTGYDGRLINNGWMNVVSTAPATMLGWSGVTADSGLHNYGTLNVSVSASGPLVFAAAFKNFGPVYVANGNLNLAAGGVQNGTVTLNNTQASVVFTGGTHFLWRGVDPIFIDGGTVSLVQDQTVGSFIFNAGSMMVNKQLTVLSSMTLRGGTFSYDTAAGSVTAAATAQVLIQPVLSYVYLYYIPLILRGTTTFIGSTYSVYTGYDGRLVNNGWMNVTSSFTTTVLGWSGVGADSGLLNYGTLNVSSPAPIYFGAPVSHHGVSTLAGRVIFSAGGRMNGTVSFYDATSMLWFTAGVFDVIVAPSRFQVSGTTTVVPRSAITVQQLWIDSGVLQTNYDVVVTDLCTIQGGQITYSVSPGRLYLTSSSRTTISIASAFTSNLPIYSYGPATWITADGGTSFTLTSPGRWLNFAPLTMNRTSAAFTGTGGFYNYHNITTLQSATISPSIFVQGGTMQVVSGTQTASFTSVLANATMDVAAAGTLAVSTATAWVAGSTLRGCGTVTAASSVALRGNIVPGCSAAASILTWTGAMSMAATTVTSIQVYPGPVMSSLVVSGNVALNGNASFEFRDGFTVAPGQYVNNRVLTANSVSGSWLSSSSLLTVVTLINTVNVTLNATGSCTNCSAITGVCDVINSQCACVANYHGSSCECPGNATHACNGHGACSPFVTACACDTGYWGVSCANSCPGGVGPSTCSGHGTCSQANGLCTCTTGYGGTDCQCPSSSSAQICSGHGTCAAGVCTCAFGYFGLDCSGVCPGGFSTPCNNHGVCNSLTGACDCSSSGYSGSACEIPPVSTTPFSSTPVVSTTSSATPVNSEQSSASSTVGASSTPASSATSQTPFSSTPFSSTVPSSTPSSATPVSSNTPIPTFCPYGYYGPVSGCASICPGGATTPCTNHGDCDYVTGVCTCTDPDFGGVACSCPARAGQVCSNRGACTANPSVCQCSSLSWGGPACECPAHLGNTCNNHGTCMHDGQCVCDPGYWGADCSIHCALPPGAPCDWCNPANSCPTTPSAPFFVFTGSALSFPTNFGTFGSGSGYLVHGGGSGGYLIQGTTSPSVVDYACATNAAPVAFSNGTVAELSVRISASNFYNCPANNTCVGSFSAVIADSDSDTVVYLSLGWNVIVLSNGTHTVAAYNNTSLRHTYRISLNQTGNGLVTLDYDGVPLLQLPLTLTFLTNPSPRYPRGSFCIGDDSTDYGGESLLQYIWVAPSALASTTACDYIPADSQAECSSVDPQCYYCGASGSCSDVLASNISSCFFDAVVEEVVLFPIPMSADQRQAIEYSTGALNFFIVFVIVLVSIASIQDSPEHPELQSDVWNFIDRVQRVASMGFLRAKLPESFVVYTGMMAWINCHIDILGTSFQEYDPVTGERRLLDIDQVVSFLGMDERQLIFNTLLIIGVLLALVLVVAIILVIGTSLRLCCAPRLDRKLSRAAKLRALARHYTPATMLRVLALAYYGLCLAVFAQLTISGATSYQTNAFVASVISLVALVAGLPLLWWYIIVYRNKLDVKHQLGPRFGKSEKKPKKKSKTDSDAGKPTEKDETPKQVAHFDKRFGVVYGTYNALNRPFGLAFMVRKLVFAILISTAAITLRVQVGLVVGLNLLLLLLWIGRRPFKSKFEFWSESVGCILDCISFLLLLAYDPNQPSGAPTAAEAALIISYVAIAVQGSSVLWSTMTVIRTKIANRRHRRAMAERGDVAVVEMQQNDLVNPLSQVSKASEAQAVHIESVYESTPVAAGVSAQADPIYHSPSDALPSSDYETIAKQDESAQAHWV
ncbi:hypothetical protein CAOG_007994 [Capsaspora owczarzaki ATCC 30864]|uniref:Membrane-associated protein n=1 Tax=Capsaspora owczarzaki (strain ATCC 30864) TaxID=595528 RepID=A0A0D2USH6_CAPO3|nr:hypothetical protein CAOG_007994 [Capsaspora owczarzaki ATCC 30864]